MNDYDETLSKFDKLLEFPKIKRERLQSSSKIDHLKVAQEIIENFGKEKLITTKAGVWCWEGTGVWQLLEDRATKKLVQDILEKKEHCVTRSLVDSVSEVLKTAIYTLEDIFNQPRKSDVINFANGELHRLGTEWELYEHNRNNYLTTQIPHKYDARAECPLFKEFLQSIFRDDADINDKIVLIFELLGYTLVSSSFLEKFALLIGSGANGKSVLLHIVREMVGSVNVAAVSPTQFNNRFQRGHLHLKLANIVTEIAEGGEISDAELKAIVSGELATAERKFHPPFDFVPFCTCWFGTNHLPHTRDFSEALFRRAIVIPFNRTFTEGVDADPYLKDKLVREMPGIINNAIKAYSNVLNGAGFTEPQSCIDAKKEWRTEADQVSQFVNEMCEIYQDYDITSQELYESYKIWADRAGIARKLNRKNFTTRILRLGCKLIKGTGGTRKIWGIRIKNEFYDNQEREEWR